MINITDEIRDEVSDYLEIDYHIADDECAFYYRCMMADMHYADADRYAILNTLFDYDIGMENAQKIDEWMYNHDEDIYDLKPEDKSLVVLASAELRLNLDFSGWITEDYKTYKFFEQEGNVMRYTDKEVTIIVKGGLVQEVYGTDKNIKVRLVDLDETDTEMLEQLEDEAHCVRTEWYDIWK